MTISRRMGGGNKNGYQGGGNGGAGGGDGTNTQDSQLLRQLMNTVNGLVGKVDDLNEAVGHAATRDDLQRLLPRDIYDVQRGADAQHVADAAARITKVEGQVTALEKSLYERDLADARQFGDVRLTAAQSALQNNAALSQGLQDKKQTAFDLQSKLLYALIGFLGSGFLMLLLYTLAHN